MIGQAIRCLRGKVIEVPEDLGAVTRFDPADEVPPAAAGLSRAAVDEIWGGVEALYRSGTQPGITLCLRRHGRRVIHRAIGHAHGNGPDDPPGARRAPMRPETPVTLFSASKAITATLVHLVAERGGIRLEDRVSRFLPEFAAHGKETTTVVQILTHRGGIPSLPAELPSEGIFDYDDTVRRLCAARPVSPAGMRMAYHALTGGFILAEVIRRATGRSIKTWLRTELKKALGLRYFDYGANQRDARRVATNYVTGPSLPFPISLVAERALSAPWNEVVDLSNDPRFFRALIPAGNLIATADEVCRFFEMLLAGGTLDGIRVLAPETVATLVRETGGHRLDATMIVPMHYSAGMMLGGSPVGLYGPDTAGAFGHLGLINIFCWADPVRDISVALLTTGKCLLSPHLLPLARLLGTISRHCEPVRRPRAAVFG